MISYMEKRKKSVLSKIASAFLVLTFGLAMVLPPAPIFAETVMNLPAPGKLVPLSPEFTAATVKGMIIHPEDALKFDFIIDSGDTGLKGDEFKDESMRIIKYFLATLTVPEDELWVNLSPYDKDRIVTDSFGRTEMGIDLLAQDYILKQLTASLMYPENEMGKKFWDRIYQKAHDLYGTANIPVNTFNKVWIIPDKAVVYESGNAVVIKESHLKVMLEEDYLNVKNNLSAKQAGSGKLVEKDAKQLSDMSSDIVREILLPEIEKEVNKGQNFAKLRQIYSAIILAAWYKNNLRETILGQVYVNKNKTGGVETADANVKEKIYGQYLSAFKKGAYNIIKEDTDKYTNQSIPRRYFSGGFTARKVMPMVKEQTFKNIPSIAPKLQEEIAGFVKAATSSSTAEIVAFQLKPATVDAAMASQDPLKGVSRIFIDNTSPHPIGISGTSAVVNEELLKETKGVVTPVLMPASQTAVSLINVDRNFANEGMNRYFSSIKVDANKINDNVRQAIASGTESHLQLIGIPDEISALNAIKTPGIRNQLTVQQIKTSVDALSASFLKEAQTSGVSVFQKIKALTPRSPELKSMFMNLKSSEIPQPVVSFIQAKVMNDVSLHIFDNMAKDNGITFKFNDATAGVANNLQNIIGSKSLAYSINDMDLDQAGRHRTEPNSRYHATEIQVVNGKTIQLIESPSSPKRDDANLAEVTDLLRKSFTKASPARQASRLGFSREFRNAKAVFATENILPENVVGFYGSVTLAEATRVPKGEQIQIIPLAKHTMARAVVQVAPERLDSSIARTLRSYDLDPAKTSSEEISAVKSAMLAGIKSEFPQELINQRNYSTVLSDVRENLVMKSQGSLGGSNLANMQTLTDQLTPSDSIMRFALEKNGIDVASVTPSTVTAMKSDLKTSFSSDLLSTQGVNQTNLFRAGDALYDLAFNQAAGSANKMNDIFDTLDTTPENPILSSALNNIGIKLIKVTDVVAKPIVLVARNRLSLNLPKGNRIAEQNSFDVAGALRAMVIKDSEGNLGKAKILTQNLTASDAVVREILRANSIEPGQVTQKEFKPIQALVLSSFDTELPSASRISEIGLLKVAKSVRDDLLSNMGNLSMKDGQPQIRLSNNSSPVDYVANKNNSTKENRDTVVNKLQGAKSLVEYGGIDFNPSALDLKINRDGNGVALPMNLQSIDEMNIDGFTPVILDIKPAGAVVSPMILGEAGPGRQPLKPAAALKKL